MFIYHGFCIGYSTSPTFFVVSRAGTSVYPHLYITLSIIRASKSVILGHRYDCKKQLKEKLFHLGSSLSPKKHRLLEESSLSTRNLTLDVIYQLYRQLAVWRLYMFLLIQEPWRTSSHKTFPTNSFEANTQEAAKRA